MMKYYINVAEKGMEADFKPLGAGIYSLAEKNETVVFSGIEINGNSGFHDIISRYTRLEFKGCVLDNDAAMCFLISKFYSVGADSECSLLSFSDKNINPNGGYNAFVRTAAVRIDKLEIKGKESFIEGVLLYNGNYSETVFQ